MAQNDATPSAQTKPPFRLRRPDRLQATMSISCPDKLVAKNHEVRTVAALVQTMDLSAFREPIPFGVAQGVAREGNAGRDATEPARLVSLWLYANVRGIGSARELDRQCTRTARAGPAAVRQSEAVNPEAGAVVRLRFHVGLWVRQTPRRWG